MSANHIQNIKEAANYISSIKKSKPKVGVILGSGLGAFVDSVNNKTIIPYSNIPHFHQTTVEGHEGRLILGEVAGVEVAVMQGRFHSYEGLNMDDVVFPTRVLAMLGIDYLILTNAAGGINLKYKQGDLVIITDHINLMGRNPLVGPNLSQLGPRFPDMTQAYCQELQTIFKAAASDIKYDMPEGVYVGVLGPTYETPAEIRMFRSIGGDIVGMSTVPETIAANHLGLRVGGISCVTNMAAGIQHVKLKHEDIKDQALKVMERFSTILVNSIAKLK
jgi:purine-nucleoside phosphorylase